MQPGEWHRLSAEICAEIPVLSGLLGVSLEIGNFCTLSTLFNQFGYVSD